MDLKAASILGLLLFSFQAFGAEKDWASIVTALQPKQGQNFEQDLTLAKALFSLERRIEALKVLSEYSDETDERLHQQLNLVSTQFYSQETANLYYEAVRLIAGFKWADAKERLDTALNKEPGQGLVLLRLIQVEMLMKQKESFRDHLLLAEDLNPDPKELQIFSARNDYYDGEEKDALKVFASLKTYLAQNQVPFVWWLDALYKSKRFSDLTAVQARLLKEHPNWSYAIDWFLRTNLLSPKETKAFTAQFEKNTKDSAKFESELEAESKRSQYYWVGYYSLETLKAPRPTQSPTPQSSVGPKKN